MEERKKRASPPPLQSTKIQVKTVVYAVSEQVAGYYDTKETLYHRPDVKWFNHTVALRGSIMVSISPQRNKRSRF